MADPKSTREDGFRNSLQDVVAFLERAAPLGASAADLKEMAELALGNDAQFRLLMNMILGERR